MAVRHYTTVRRYAPVVTPEELANLAHLRRARDLMDREYARPLDVAALARAALMSSAHFSRQFRAAYGETPYAYLMTRRIERAKALLRGGETSVTEVCLAVGCSSLGSFSARFTQLVGETPTAYRARDHGALASVPGCLARDLTRPSRPPRGVKRSRVGPSSGIERSGIEPGATKPSSGSEGNGAKPSRAKPSRIEEARGALAA